MHDVTASIEKYNYSILTLLVNWLSCIVSGITTSLSKIALFSTTMHFYADRSTFCDVSSSTDMFDSPACQMVQKYYLCWVILSQINTMTDRQTARIAVANIGYCIYMYIRSPRKDIARKKIILCAQDGFSCALDNFFSRDVPSRARYMLCVQHALLWQQFRIEVDLLNLEWTVWSKIGISHWLGPWLMVGGPKPPIVVTP